HHRRAGRPRTDGPGGAGDLRGPPHGHGPGRGRGAPVQRRDQGPFLREQDLPALLRRLPRPLGGGAIMTAMDAGTRPIITLDGPAASGKSSAAKAVAARLGIAYVSSGLLYRAVTLLALREGVPLDDEAALLAMLARHDVRLVPDAQRDRLTVDGEEVAHLLHTDDIDANVSEVARLPGVRAWVTERLRELE